MTTKLRPSPLTPGRRVALVLGLVATLALTAQTAVGVVAALGRTTVTEDVAVPTPGQLFSLSSGEGDVEVYPSKDGRLHVQAIKRFGLREPRVVQSGAGNDLRLSTTCRTLEPSCSVDFRVAIPAELALTVSTGSGDVDVRGVAGAVTVSAGSGDIAVADAAAPVSVRAGSGDITLENVAGRTVDARTGSGDIDAAFEQVPVEVRARTGAGDVSLVLPGSAAYAVDVDTGAGDETVTVDMAASSPNRIYVRTGSGDVSVVPGS